METEKNFYDQILSSSPSSGTLYIILSALKKQGDFKRVVKECLKALQAHPLDIHLRKILAETYLEMGQITQAETEMERVTSLMSELIPIYKAQAELLNRQKRKQEALEAIQIYLTHRPDDRAGLNLREALIPDGPPAEEMTGDTDSLPWPQIAEREETELRTEEMDAYHEKEEDISGEGEDGEEVEIPEQDLLHLATPTLAEVYVKQGLIQDAISVYEKVIERNPNDEISKQRIEALKAMPAEEKAEQFERENMQRQRKEWMVSILETWLTNIRERTKAPVSAM